MGQPRPHPAAAAAEEALIQFTNLGKRDLRLRKREGLGVRKGMSATDGAGSDLIQVTIEALEVKLKDTIKSRYIVLSAEAMAC